MAEIVNLNKRRKARTRDARQSEAAANRVKYGRTKVETENDRRAAERAAKLHQGRKRDGEEPL
jgi:hypothetical protein